jgi:hypothetical protein
MAIAKSKGATLRVGPELEIPGYGCLDHFLEGQPTPKKCAQADMQVIRSCTLGRCSARSCRAKKPRALSAILGCKQLRSLDLD